MYKSSFMAVDIFAIDIHGVILLIVCSVLFVVQLVYYFGLYNRLLRHTRQRKKGRLPSAEDLPPLSVVIYSKHEAANLRKNLPLILEQDYPTFEVIVINDGSGDESNDTLAELEEKYPNLYHSFIPENSRYINHQKLGITLGVKASKYEKIVVTEAGCKPVSNQWLRLIGRNFTDKTEIVLGYSSYKRQRGWFNKYISFDALFNAMRYLGFAQAHRPYMGIGCNMAYNKELFFRENSFSSHLKLRRGDDDLFINQMANKYNTRIECSPEATMLREQTSYREWREEKLGYEATRMYYKGMQKSLLGFETASRLLFFVCIIGTLVYSLLSMQWQLGAACLLLGLIRYLIQVFMVNRTARALGEQRRYYFSLPVFDWLLPMRSWQFRLWNLTHSASNRPDRSW